MKYKNLIQGIVILGSLSLGGAAMAAGPSASMLANTCAGCHGTDGSSNGPATPSIAAIKAEYFIETMQAYKDGSRKATVMDRIAKGYTDDEIKLMAGYFAEQKFVRITQDTDKKMASSGKRLHDRYCEKCHEEGGKLSDDGGILAGQMMPYLRYSLADFTSGSREMPKKMKSKVDEMMTKSGKNSLEELVHYYGSQK
ncbi:MAG: cytochrome c [Thiohalomonadaceae bacterium]